MLSLPDVTLLAIDTLNHAGTARVLEHCQSLVRFGDCVVYTDQPLHPAFLKREITARCIRMERCGLDAVLAYLWYAAAFEINTSHMLYVHWDSGICNVEAWTGEFMQYDYIGAPWWYGDGLDVGNGGFSLRSKALMQYLGNHEEMRLRHPEDSAICRRYRPRLEANGFKFAPFKLAQQFSIECVKYDGKPFGFHGPAHWRLLGAEEKALREKLRGEVLNASDKGACHGQPNSSARQP